MLKRRGFKSSLRLAIMIYLLAKNRVFFTDLVEALNITPGNLWSHLEKLRDEGLINIRYVISGRPRAVISITEKGFEETIQLFKNMVEILNRILDREKRE